MLKMEISKRVLSRGMSKPGTATGGIFLRKPLYAVFAFPKTGEKTKEKGNLRSQVSVSVFAERRCIAAFPLWRKKGKKNQKEIAACIRPAMLPNAMQYTRSKVPAKMSRKREKTICDRARG
jgi:hypothetical protein